jgi:enoyl-CoA hydratase
MWAFQMGLPRAKYFLMTGEPLSFPEAAGMGLINEAVPRDEVLGRANALARRLADGPGPAIRGTKRTLNRIAEVLGSGVLEFAAEQERLSLFSEDHKEAVAAFFEERPPVFKNR